MKISNKHVELEYPDLSELDKPGEEMPVTIRFPLTKAEITITGRQAIELWKALSLPYGD